MKMTANTSCLEIQVHSSDGHVSAFTQSEAETVQKLIEQMHPHRMFTQPYLTVAGQHSLTIFPSATVARVDLVMRDFPDWPFYFGIHDATELTEEEFRLLYADAMESLAHSRGMSSVFAVIDLTNGERIYLAILIHAREENLTRVDFGMLLQQFLTSPSFHARRLGGGAIVINPAHIRKLQFHPGLPQPPLNAWCADPITEAGQIS
jgi:hypothetical protein